MEFNEEFETELAGMNKWEARVEVQECFRDIKAYEAEIERITEFIEYVKQKFNI